MERKEKSLPTYKEMYSWEERAKDFMLEAEEMCQNEINNAVTILGQYPAIERDLMEPESHRKAILLRLSVHIRVVAYLQANRSRHIGVTDLLLFNSFMESECMTFKALHMTKPKFFSMLGRKAHALITERNQEEAREMLSEPI